MQHAGIGSFDPARIDTFVYAGWRFDGETAEFDFALEGADVADRVVFTERVAFEVEYSAGRGASERSEVAFEVEHSAGRGASERSEVASRDHGGSVEAGLVSRRDARFAPGAPQPAGGEVEPLAGRGASERSEVASRDHGGSVEAGLVSRRDARFAPGAPQPAGAGAPQPAGAGAPQPAGADAPQPAGVERVVALLGGVLGTSYFKAAAPGRIRIDAEGLTAEAVGYLRAVYREGLAEFAYRAGLPGKVEPVIEHRRPARACTASVVPDGAPLVPIGGGKDSVVSVESLRAAGVDPVQFAVNPNVVIRRVAEASGLPLVEARRTIDPALLELNARGARNGHVPVTAMNSLIAIAQARLLGLGPVVMSNESSASDPTLDWHGEAVNHQWSKSLEAERMLAAVLEPQAGIAGAYFSLLRPFTELRIARAFAKTDRYDASIVSCNRAFRMGAGDPGWCGDCDKCRFVFLALSAVMPPDRLIAIIGTDMFADETQLPGYRALMGLDAHKPFECVGEEAECTVAASLASRHPHWAASVVLRALHAEIPGLAQGSPALEAQVFGEAPAEPLPSPYSEARYALV
ncbi:hypothetical protein QT381_11080 [Galbitalea sp. SE-J8]|uniref:hypothetical protein n=1 Tax=Galbitalea sp. SE-J8 TaxID=3054952 RepID=UPI00259C6C0E|nr:hypothetical protein [Galbitalea sp. SE-J8]MDM4763552.1 hypothetical protein [Galbitalea sp. SE-J8]